ncbi:MAG: hypothetical protein AAF602_24110 [Myxococcota bacterium]
MPFWVRVLLVSATAALAVTLAVLMPAEAALAEGWHTPILAFELARTPADLTFLAGPDAEPLRDAMDLGHRVDMVFPVAYGLLLASAFAWRGFGRVGVMAALLAIPADWAENLVLIRITEELRNGGDGAAGLALLPYATWAKWGLLAVAGGLLGVINRSRAPILAGMGGLYALTATAAWATGAPRLGEAMGATVALLYIAVMIHSLRDSGPPCSSEARRGDAHPG